MAAPEEPGTTILCISHLEWTHTLFQRPQQVMGRMSDRHHVIYYKEWAFKEWMAGKAKTRTIGARTYEAKPRLIICDFAMPFPRFRNHLRFFENIGHWMALRRLRSLIGGARGPRLILWYYFPVFLELIRSLDPDLVVYECMDNYIALAQGALSSIVGPIRERETQLLQRADIIFYGSKTLMDERSAHSQKSYHFPTGVDPDHFGQAVLRNSPPLDMRGIQKPILGYWGAVDQRIDYAVLDHCARQRPDWSIVLIGPMVTISERDIAPFLTLPNVHWMGPKQYQDLPHYAMAIDVCILPFKISEEGRYLNPTKTLEYLAAGKPVVSTRIPEIERFYAGMVTIAESRSDFVRQVEMILSQEPDPLEKERRMAKARAHSWEAMVERMEGIVMAALDG